MTTAPAAKVEPILRIRDLGVTYGGTVRALDGISLEVATGSIVSVLGANGAGKTTLLRSISGLLSYHEAQVIRGSVEFDGESTIGRGAPALVRAGIGQVMEGRHVFPELSVADNLAAGGFANRREIAERTEWAYELFPRLQDRRTQLAGYLSGGEQQMLAIARAMMTRPRLLLLDEPSLGLAPLIVEQIFETLRGINDSGVTILLVEQAASMALALADTAYVLSSGRLVLEGPAAELAADDEVRNVYLGLAPVAGATAAGSVRPTTDTRRKAILEVRDLTLRFGGLNALSSVSFSVPEHRTVALIGPNGAGKTSMLNCLTGVVKPSEGSVRFDGTEIIGRGPRFGVGLGIARTFQNLGLFGNLDMVDNLMLGRHHLMSGGFIAGMIHAGRARSQEAKHRREVERVIELLELDGYRGIPTSSLPYGIQKRIELGRALCMNPRLLLLDEPVAGMNPSESNQMAGFIERIVEESPVSMLIVEHDMSFVNQLADWMVVLDFGRKLADDRPEAVMSDPAVIEAYLGVPHDA